MSDRDTVPREALAEELERAHKVTATEAAERAGRMAKALRPRFATWVRRELRHPAQG